MRLHRLALTAFGPFGGSHRIDFDQLSEAGLFLLHGATGAGKTSVLDAVCFALYGGVPGARQQPGGLLRSDHADPHTLTRVELELTVGGRRLEVTRIPEQPRPRRRGGGTTREKAQSWLREYRPEAGTWVGLSRSHQEIGEEISQLLGMNRDQFCQVVLLPQGDFARFLRAGAEERAKLLGRLFDTGRFAAVEERLGDMRRSAQREVLQGDEQLLALAQRMRQAAGPSSELDTLPLPGGAPESRERSGAAGRGGASMPGQRGADGARRQAGGPAQPRRAAGQSETRGPRARRGRAGEGAQRQPLAAGEPGLDQAVLECAALARTEARERLTIASLAARAAEETHTRGAAELTESHELARRQRRHTQAQRRSAALREESAQLADVQRRLEWAHTAEAVAPLLALRDTAADEHRRAEAAAEHARRQLPGEHSAQTPQGLTELERAARQELGSLDASRKAEERSADIDRELRRLEWESGRDDDLLREAGEWLAGWEAGRQSLLQRVDRAQSALTEAEHLAGQLEPARSRLAAAHRREELTGESAVAEAELLSVRERSAASREHWLDLRDRRLRGIASELAAALEPGEPCAVCGGTEHPEPARPIAGHVDEAAEEGAREAHQRAEAEREEAERRLSRLRESLAAASAESTDATVAELGGAVEELESAHAAARERAADAHAAKEALEAAEREHTHRLTERQEAERRTAARTSHREALLREQSGLVEEVRQARGGESSVAERAARLERHVGLLAAAAEAVREARAAAQRLTEAQNQVDQAVRQAGFATAEEAATAVLGESERRTLREWVESRQAEAAAVASELDDPELTAAAERPAADPAAAERAVEAATAALREASAVEDAARTRCAELDQLSEQAAREARRLAPLREGYERTARLAQLAAGTSAENERRMRLESYVLAARLEQVAGAATSRLARMSAGRYTLVHSDQRSGGRARSGLGLRVVDSWTGSERDTATLSGGETFFASLALALGLADVVTDEAGGTRLDTLFIDEGFGSLDGETLDEVLEVLDSLRERDRCVGIVSHVPELRQRVPARLEVVKSRHGSAVRHRMAPSGS